METIQDAIEKLTKYAHDDLENAGKEEKEFVRMSMQITSLQVQVTILEVLTEIRDNTKPVSTKTEPQLKFSVHPSEVTIDTGLTICGHGNCTLSTFKKYPLITTGLELRAVYFVGQSGLRT